MLENVKKILIHQQTIFSRLDELGEQITQDYQNKELIAFGSEMSQTGVEVPCTLM